jgi:hypothetical protein
MAGTHLSDLNFTVGATKLITAGKAGSVLTSPLSAVNQRLKVRFAADDCVSDAGQVFDTAAADEDDGVLLKVMPHSGDVGGNTGPKAVTGAGEEDAGDLPNCGVRLSGCHRKDFEAGPPFLRAKL